MGNIGADAENIQSNRRRRPKRKDDLSIPLIEIPVPGNNGEPVCMRDDFDHGEDEVEATVENVSENRRFFLFPTDTVMVSERKPGTKRRRKPLWFLLPAVAVACLLTLVSFAWFYYRTERSVSTEDGEVMVPYYLYLLEETSSDYFHLNVVNMHPDEKKQVVFCVSNEDVSNKLAYSIGRTSDFNYELAMNYTQNIPLKYTLYRLEQTDSEYTGEKIITEVPGSGTPVRTYWKKSGNHLPQDEERSSEETETNNREMYGDGEMAAGVINVGKYDVYPNDGDNQQLHLKTVFNGTSGSTSFPKHYYLIEIEWDDLKKTGTFSSYLKETDLVYVMVRAMQPRPEEKSTQSPQP